MRTRIFGALVVGMAAVSVVTLAVPASAAGNWDYWSGVTISCVHGDQKKIDTFYSSNAWNAVYVYQTTTSPSVAGQYHLQSYLGNNTSAKNASDNQMVSWGSVIPSTYYLWVTTEYDYNCNGILPGNGNTSLTGKVNFL